MSLEADPELTALLEQVQQGTEAAQEFAGVLVQESQRGIRWTATLPLEVSERTERIDALRGTLKGWLQDLLCWDRERLERASEVP